MTSQNCNSRALSRALRVALAAAAITGSVAHAADETSKFVLTADLEGVGGHALVAGRYDTALAEIEKKAKNAGSDLAAIKTNQCVAYAMQSDLAAAHSACSDAIVEANRDVRLQTSGSLRERMVYSQYLAITYSNRAVVNWLRNDSAGAAQDLASAHAKDPQADHVSQNLAALERLREENQVARVAVAPKR